MIKFAHLHSHNMYSLLDSLGSPDQIAKKAKELGFKYQAVTNHGSTDGLIQFQQSCINNDIIPISGVELYIVPSGMDKVKGEKRGHICIWIKNEDGYHNVLRMLTIANLDMFYYRPRVDYETLLNHCEGLCIGTACSSSFLNLEGGVDFFEKLHNKIGNDLYLEIMPHDYPEQVETNKLALELSKKYGTKLIATNDCHYVNEEDAISHEILLACQTKKKWDDPDRWRFSVDGLFLCSPEFMIEKFKKQGGIDEETVLQAIENTIKVAEKCENFRIEKRNIILPIPPQYEGMDEKQVIRKLCNEGIKRLNLNFTQDYKDRLKYELSVIEDFEVVRYFLIVADIINWCAENDILTGPGRGSAAGCLVSYLLGITKVDPIKYGLLFERFLNPGRKGAMPDIDCDIEDIKRAKVVERLKTIYGENNIAGITTFLKIEDKTAIRDVARVFDVNLFETNSFSKSIVDDLETALETSEGVIYKNKYPEVVKHALALRGQIKAHGRHAAASIISPIDLSLGTRAYLATRSNQLVVGLDGGDAENQGLVKLDILGLSTLSVISMALKLIEKNHNKVIDLEKIDLEDADIYKEISAGNTVGCFQIGTHALTSLIKQMGVSSILELSDAVALVRPGAFDSGATERYIDRKHGAQWEPKHPIYEEITKKTYSEVIYQEQVIFVIHKVAGLSLADSDAVRKIIGKKRDPKYFEKYKNDFVNGCLGKKTFSENEALAFWEELKHHANYSFNLSHSLSYSIITYWTAWLKHYFPTEFICASLTHGSASQKKALLEEAQRLNLIIIPPRIGISDIKNWTAKDGKLYVPFIEVKGLGPKNIETIESYVKSGGNGFFNTEEVPVIKGKLKTILDEIGAFDGKITETIDNYFDLGYTFNPKKKYPRLYNLIGHDDKTPVVDLISGNIYDRNYVKVVKKRHLKGLKDCNLCDVRKGCKAPVRTTFGSYNIMIVDEVVGWFEDKKGEQMIGDAAEKMLFPTLQKHGFEREDFCLSSIIKCNCKKPDIDVIKNCSRWLKREVEIINPTIILTFGNTPVKLFKNEDFGIQKLNGTCEWNEEYGCYICFSVSPTAALFHSDAKGRFDVGIQNFVEKLENICGFK